MNDTEIKQIWNAGDHLPVINFPLLQRLSDKADDELRRNARKDAISQASVAVLSVASLYFYPKMYIALILVVILAIWYVRELRRLSLGAGLHISSSTVRDRIAERMKEIRSYFWRTRIAVLVATPSVLLAAYYGIGMFDSWESFTLRAGPIAKMAVIGEILVIICTEIYFKILYTPALKHLENVLEEFDLSS